MDMSFRDWGPPRLTGVSLTIQRASGSSGSVWTGQPRGREAAIGGLQVYVAAPAEVRDPTAAILRPGRDCGAADQLPGCVRPIAPSSPTKWVKWSEARCFFELNQI